VVFAEFDYFFEDLGFDVGEGDFGGVIFVFVFCYRRFKGLWKMVRREGGLYGRLVWREEGVDGR
jgi:hypothetical protein